MQIDMATPADASRLATIHVAARQHAMPWLPVLHGPDAVCAYFANVVLPTDRVLVARDHGQIIGFAACNADWLTHLYVAPAHWGRGAATLLLDASRANTERLQLWVFQRNMAARHFYSRRGFQDGELTDGQGNEEKMPDLRMVWHRAR